MIWFLALSIFIVFPAHAQPSSEFGAAGDTVKIEPGSAQTLSVSVSAKKGEYKASVSLPGEKWEASLFKKRFRIEGEKRTELLRISVPQMTRAGVYPVFYKLERKGEKAEAKVFVKVPLRRNVNFEVSGVPKIALKGDSVIANLNVENGSNVEETVFVDKKKVSLDPGEKKTVQVIKFAETVGSQSFSFSARRKGKDAKQFVRNYRVVSPNDQPNLKWKKYSGEIGLRANQFGGGQLFARGQETVGNSRLNFNIESPGLGLQNRFFRNRSRYSASLVNPGSYQIRLGDRSFSASRLTGSASGFGAGGRYEELEKYNIGAYYFGSRRGRNRNEFGFDVKRNLNKKYQASVNVGRKNRFGFSGTSVSSGISGNPTNLLEFEAESSLDFSSSGQGFSYFGRARFGNDSHFFSAEYESFSQSNVSFQRRSQSLVLRGETEALGTRLFSSYRNRISSLGNKRTYFQIGVSRRRFGFSYKRRNGPIGKKDGVQGNVSLSGDRFSFYSRGRVEWFENGNQRKRFSSRIGYRTERFSASIRGRYYRESFQKSFGLSASGSYKWKSGFRLKAHSSVQKRFNSFRGVVQGHRLELSYKLRSQAQIAARGFYRSGFWGSALEVSIPLSVPVKKDRSVGLIEGRVIDENRNPIPGAIVLVENKAAVTGKNGKYSVRQNPGEYSIQVSSRSVNPNQIVKGVERSVRALGGKKIRRTIRIVEGGTIEVKFKNGGAGTKVKAVGESESYQKRTGKDGTVRFFGLFPGGWTIRSENKKKKVNLEAGDSVSVELEKEENIEFFN